MGRRTHRTFRWTGDVRVRGEDFPRAIAAVPPAAGRTGPICVVSIRRKLNDDFTAAFALATGSLGDAHDHK